MGMQIWSPDGRQIVFTALRDGNSEIYVMNRDGSAVKNLSRHPAVDSQPAWSPDGKRIAFVSNRDGAEEIYVMDSEGNQLRRMTPGRGETGAPRWQP